MNGLRPFFELNYFSLFEDFFELDKFPIYLFDLFHLKNYIIIFYLNKIGF